VRFSVRSRWRQCVVVSFLVALTRLKSELTLLVIGRKITILKSEHILVAICRKITVVKRKSQLFGAWTGKKMKKETFGVYRLGIWSWRKG